MLYVDESTSTPPIHVANGLFEESIKLHHGKSIPIGLGVVSITKFVCANALLPIPEGKCVRVNSAQGMFILWPRRLIVVMSKGESAPKNLCPPPH